ncbi:MAG TPA: DUF4334 domain-containing protein [Dokdonella sp.]
MQPTAVPGVADDAAARLAALRGETDAAAALALFDALPAVRLDEMLGAWRGEGLPSGHPLDGVLENLGWHGKRFDAIDAAHPLIFAARAGTRYAVDPARLPVGFALRHARWLRTRAAARLFAAAGRALRTRRPAARLRMTEFRGVVTATMIYDAKPIADAFRRIDADTRLGVMDLRGAAPYLFVLRRESS